jgi:hypothetical protein
MSATWIDSPEPAIRMAEDEWARERTEVCDHCQGSGEHRFSRSGSQDPQAVECIPCPRCGGDGALGPYDGYPEAAVDAYVEDRWFERHGVEGVL